MGFSIFKVLLMIKYTKDMVKGLQNFSYKVWDIYSRTLINRTLTGHEN